MFGVRGMLEPLVHAGFAVCLAPQLAGDGDRRVVGNAIKPCPFARFPAKCRYRPPQCDRDFLHNVLPVLWSIRIYPRQAPQRTFVFCDQPEKNFPASVVWVRRCFHSLQTGSLPVPKNITRCVWWSRTSRSRVNQFLEHRPKSLSKPCMVDVIRWDEKAGLRRDAVGSQVIDALAAQEIKETGNEED